MPKTSVRVFVASVVVCTIALAVARAQQPTPLTPAQKEQRIQTEKELESVAIIDRKVRMLMRDGVRLATDIYRPKNAAGKVPTIWVRTPYNFNFWDVRNGVPADMTNILTAIKRGYAYILQNELRPMFPPNTSQADLIRESKSFDLAQQLPPVEWSKALWHLPEQDILKAVDGPPGIFADAMPVPTGGRMIQRTPNDPDWYKGGLYHDDMPLNVPGLWFMSWYDVSIGPNLALYNHARKTAKGEIAHLQRAIIAPVTHCAYTPATEQPIVGARSMGDARLDYQEIFYSFFD